MLSSNKVNTLRFHLLKDFLGTVPNSTELGITRPSFSWGQNNIAPQYFPRNTETVSDALYVNLSAHDLKFGGELSRVVFPFEAHFNEKGVFAFNTDASFNAANPATWPFSMTIQKPGFYRYQTYTIGLFAQDDWRVASRLRLNLGIRYDLDTNMRLNDFFEGLIGDPRFPGIERFISKDRGLDLGNVQPRVGVDLGHPRQRIARRPRRLRRLRHAQPAVVRRDRAGHDDRRRGDHPGPAAAEVLSRRQRGARRLEPRRVSRAGRRAIAL